MAGAGTAEKIQQPNLHKATKSCMAPSVIYLFLFLIMERRDMWEGVHLSIRIRVNSISFCFREVVPGIILYPLPSFQALQPHIH